MFIRNDLTLLQYEYNFNFKRSIDFCAICIEKFALNQNVSIQVYIKCINIFQV